jgi:DUF917 family protein
MTTPIILHSEPHAIHVMTEESGACPVCRTMRHFWIVRDGRTLCLYCDGERRAA